jgi:hypothetical protein
VSSEGLWDPSALTPPRGLFVGVVFDPYVLQGVSFFGGASAWCIAIQGLKKGRELFSTNELLGG